MNLKLTLRCITRTHTKSYRENDRPESLKNFCCFCTVTARHTQTAERLAYMACKAAMCCLQDRGYWCGSECAGCRQDFSKVLAASPDVPAPLRYQPLLLHLLISLLLCPSPYLLRLPSTSRALSALSPFILTREVRGCVPLVSLDRCSRAIVARVSDACRCDREVGLNVFSIGYVFCRMCSLQNDGGSKMSPDDRIL